MKTPDQFAADVARRVDKTWAATIASTAPAPAWPHTFALGEPTSTQLAAGFTQAMATVEAWRSWQATYRLPVAWRTRRVQGTDQELPTHVTVPDLDTAADLAGGRWPGRITRARARARVLGEHYSHLATPDRTLAAVEKLTDVEFDLLRRAADWFATHDATGLTPRQVPIAGLHAKSLNTGHALIRELAGVPDLGLLPPHPARIHFTYLDPAHRAAGRRRHDSATVGDPVALPYLPQTVIISENKDTAIHFPELTGAVSVEGVGKGGATVAAFDWITHAEQVIYWGDMDADGLEILDGFRAAGVPARSILMDPGSYTTWERFGTDVDRHGKPLGPRPPRPVPHLTEVEAQLYHKLVASICPGHRRVEQERIPLQIALNTVLGT